jgi:hypothetical protein
MADSTDKAAAAYKVAVNQAELALERVLAGPKIPAKVNAAEDRRAEAEAILQKCLDGRCYGVPVKR